MHLCKIISPNLHDLVSVACKSLGAKLWDDIQQLHNTDLHLVVLLSSESFTTQCSWMTASSSKNRIREAHISSHVNVLVPKDTNQV